MSRIAISARLFDVRTLSITEGVEWLIQFGCGIGDLAAPAYQFDAQSTAVTLLSIRAQYVFRYFGQGAATLNIAIR